MLSDIWIWIDRMGSEHWLLTYFVFLCYIAGDESVASRKNRRKIKAAKRLVSRYANKVHMLNEKLKEQEQDMPNREIPTAYLNSFFSEYVTKDDFN